MVEVTEENIRELAYQLWERDGSPTGKDDEYWHAAEELLADEGQTEVVDEPILTIPAAPLAGLQNK